MINEELRERIKKINAAHDKADQYLKERNCHLCQHAIFTNGNPRSQAK